MKKLFFLCGIAFLMCGCDVEYNLEIEDAITHTYREDLKLISKSEEESNDMKNDPWPIPAFRDASFTSEIPEKIPGVSYYKKDLYQANGFNNLNIKFDFNSYDFYKSSTVSYCYQSFYKIYDQKTDTTVLKSSAEFLCYENYPLIENVVIRVTISNPVIENNADKVNENVYEWYINKSNYKNKPLSLTYDGGFTESPKTPDSPSVKNDDSSFNFQLALIVIGLFIIFIFGAIFYNVKKKNQIGK